MEIRKFEFVGKSGHSFIVCQLQYFCLVNSIWNLHLNFAASSPPPIFVVAWFLKLKTPKKILSDNSIG